jgi:cell division protein FtsB
MAFLRNMRISTFLFAGVLIYFSIHFFIGQQGLLSWRSYVLRADSLTEERNQLIAKRDELQKRVKRYAPAHADADYVEERAFSQLGLIGSQDIVVRLPETAALNTSSASSQTPNP